MGKSIEELADKATQKAAELTEETSELLSQIKEEGADLMEEAEEKSMELVREVVEATHSLAEESAEAMHKVGERAKEIAAETIDEVKQGAKKAAQALSDMMEKAAEPPQKVIDLQDVSIYHTRGRIGNARRHPSDELVLSDVNLTIREGEMVYLIGKVGSGKSTLLKTLYAEVPLYEGRGMVAGFDLRSLRRKDVPYLRRKMGVVFQDYQLLTDRNVTQNLQYVMKATGWKDRLAMDKRIGEVLGMVGLNNKEYKMPFELSGGEQQRLAIARALINHPRVILADEPTGNLDPAAAEGIMALFRTIVHTGCSIVMSTHNIGNIQAYPGRTFRFAQGRMEEIDIHSILGIVE